MNHGSLIVAYHGCDVTVRDDLVSGRLECLDQSKNSYDWLGDGIYFFEADADRALRFANASSQQPQKQYTRRPIATPAVVGALLRVQSCLDMTTQEGRRLYIEKHAELVKDGVQLQPNAPASEDDEEIILRHLDRFVINAICAEQEKNGNPYDIVRGAFPQGKPIATSSAFHENTHIQLAVREERCILGWFVGKAKMLDPTFLELARLALKEAETDREQALKEQSPAERRARKPRLRAMPSKPAGE